MVSVKPTVLPAGQGELAVARQQVVLAYDMVMLRRQSVCYSRFAFAALAKMISQVHEKLSFLQGAAACAKFHA